MNMQQNGGLKYNYILVDPTSGQWLGKWNGRYDAVTEAIKQEKEGLPYEIMALGKDGEYHHDEIGHQQVTTRPQIIAARRGTTAQTSNIDRELARELNGLSEVCKTAAGAVRKGQFDDAAKVEFADEVFRVLHRVGFTRQDIMTVVGDYFPTKKAQQEEVAAQQ